MIFKIFKKIFTSSNTTPPENTPGRTFKRILTGEYFGCKDKTMAQKMQREAQKNKISLIEEHQVSPKYITYIYENEQLTKARVAFQKEVLAEKWNMLHITEISFFVYVEDFKTLESMAKVSLQDDFEDITKSAGANYKGKERRKTDRN